MHRTATDTHGCPVCGARVSPRLGVAVQDCGGCGADLKPVYAPERALILYLGISSAIVAIPIGAAALASFEDFLALMSIGGGILAVVLCYLNRRFISGFVRKDSRSGRQFSLIQALHATLFMAFLFTVIHRPHEEHVRVSIAAACFGGILELARYGFAKRAQNSKS